MSCLKSSLLATLLLMATPVSTSAEEHSFITNGVADEALVTATGWENVDGFYTSKGPVGLTSNLGIGEGDFSIRARIRLHKMDRSACGLRLRNSFFGFEGAHDKMFITGKLFDGARGLPIGQPEDFMTDDQAFDFQAIRKGGEIRFLIDGREVLKRSFTKQPIGKFGFTPSRAVVGISDLHVEGNLDAEYLNYVPPEEAYRMKRVEGVDKVVLLPPGPKNPRNSEGDFIRLKDGRTMLIYTHFTGGGSDHAAGHLAARFSRDGGRSWTSDDVVVVPNQAGFNVMSVSLLRLQDDRIAFFYLRKDSLTDCRPLLRISEDEAASWSEPVEVITDQVGYYVMNNDRVIQTRTGRLICPVALHNTPDYPQPDWDGIVMCYLSDDAARTWRRSKTSMRGRKSDGTRITYQEPGVVELSDGRIMMFIRTGEGSQYLAWSADGGETWSKPMASKIKSPKSPATIERLPGRKDLLMAWNDHSDIPPARRGNRTPFAIAISEDDGKTWSKARILEDDPNGWYCYTAMDFIDGRVVLGHCAGDRRLGGLNTTQITSFPIDWLGLSRPDPKAAAH